ncbi:MAG: aminopeptidase P family protein [Bacilli bacterium]|nr:aminopeptidase P family protein [Bacilli bacterium]
MDKTLFFDRRRKLVNEMKEQSFALFFSGQAPHKTADQRYHYEPNRNFYYLTGLTRENMILLLIKGNHKYFEYLFVEEPSDYATKWLGSRMTKEEAAALSGIEAENILYAQEFEAFVSTRVLSDSRKALVQMPKSLYLDLYRDQPLSRPISLEQVSKLLENYPEIRVEGVNGLIDSMRMVKSDLEIEAIERAIEHTRKGIEAIMRSARANVSERSLDALFDYTIRLDGSEGVAFDSIVAGGKRATILHYEANNQMVEDKEMILLDLGAKSGLYAADISRTFPANGKFTSRQKALYELVLSVNKAIIEMVKPGLLVSDLNQLAKQLLGEGMIKLGLIKDLSETDNYYYHNVSHYLGLDVHDVGTYQVPLKPGVVLTVEPGIYVESEGIGIRIEDDVLVTESGSRNLSSSIVKEIVDIERLIQG